MVPVRVQSALLTSLSSEFLEDFLRRQLNDPSLLFEYYINHKLFRGAVYPTPSPVSCLVPCPSTPTCPSWFSNLSPAPCARPLHYPFSRRPCRLLLTAGWACGLDSCVCMCGCGCVCAAEAALLMSSWADQHRADPKENPPLETRIAYLEK